MRDSRAAIFRAAAHEFAERGFEAGGTDRIATRARVNKAMLYYHFGSKAGLYAEVVRDMVGAVGARVRAIADGSGSAEHKLDSWISALVEEAAARPWFPPIMLRELAARAPHFDATTFHMMNAVLAGVTDVIAQGKREGAFRDVDPLLAHLTIMPPVLIFFARQRVLAGRKLRGGLAEPRQLEQFVRHMQASARGMLRKAS
ncbi:MAG TPA: helix-turn-helix domain-containing protein [Vicinamibacterales bacterium]|nr:helix-turn-helix domain-containing protein [Vicinamibacterales bacterium]